MNPSDQALIGATALSVIQDFAISDAEIRAALAQHDDWREADGVEKSGNWDDHIAKLGSGEVTDEIIYALIIILDQRRSSRQ